MALENHDWLDTLGITPASNVQPCQVTGGSSGGLGNQMFRLASLLYVCGNLKAPCCVADVSGFGFRIQTSKHLNLK